MLPAGTYYVNARTPSAEVREQIAIGAGDIVKRAVPLSLAHVKLAATLGGKPAPDSSAITFRVIRLDGESREIARTIAKEPEFDLSAGRYRLEAALGASNVIAATEIALAAGQAQNITLPLEGGSITFKRDAGGAAAGDVYWEVRDEKQRAVLRSSQPSRPPFWPPDATSSAPRHPINPCAIPSRSRPTSTASSIFPGSEPILNPVGQWQPHFDQAPAA